MADADIEMLTPAYKGICADRGAIATLAQPDAVIVDVYLDALVAKDTAYADSYAYDNSYFFFDQAYRSLLEGEILPHLQIGRQVYLRISVRANEDGYRLPYTVSAPDTDAQPQYLAVCLNSEDAQKAYCAAMQYLLELFASQKTALAGIVLGHALDDSLQYHYAGMISLKEYQQAVVNTVLHTESILGSLFPKAILYLPVSDTQYPSYYSSYDLDGVYATSMLLDGVARMLEDMGQGVYTFHPLLEIDAMPFDLTQQPWLTSQDDVRPLQMTGLEDSLLPDQLMQPLLGYESVADTCAVVWSAPRNCAEIPWTISYIYFYYTMQMPQVSTFFACLHPELLNDKLYDLISHIDTVYAAQVTKSSLPYFDLSSFDSLIQEKKAGQAKQLYTVALTAETRGLYVGRYSYWNFAAAIGTLQWMQSFGCTSLAADGGSSYGRALLAQTSADPYGGEILYRFANPEDFSLCDALALTLAVSDQEGNYVPAKLYLTLYGEDERVEGSCLIQNGKMTTVTLSGVALDSVKACSAVSIRIEPIGNYDHRPLNLYVFNIEGLSRIWDDATLQLNILEQREIRNTVPQEIPEFGVYPVLLVTALFILVLLGAFLSLRASKQRKL
jgi:hypothetical protein